MEANRHGFDKAFVDTLQFKCPAVLKTLQAITANEINFSEGYEVLPRVVKVGHEDLQADFVAEALLLNVSPVLEKRGKVHIEVEAVGRVDDELDQRMVQYAMGSAVKIKELDNLGIAPRQYVVALRTSSKSEVKRFDRRYRLGRWDGTQLVIDYTYTVVFLSEELKGTLFYPLAQCEEEISELNIDTAMRQAREIAKGLPDELQLPYIRNLSEGILFRYKKKLSEELKVKLQNIMVNPEEVLAMANSCTGIFEDYLNDKINERIPVIRQKIRQEVQQEVKQEIRQEVRQEVKQEIQQETVRDMLTRMIDSGLDESTIQQIAEVDIKTIPELWSRYQQRHGSGARRVTKLDLG